VPGKDVPGGRSGRAGAAGRAAGVPCVPALAAITDAPAARSLSMPGRCRSIPTRAVPPVPTRRGLAVPGPAGMTGPAQPIRAPRLRVPRPSRAYFPAAAGAHRPGFPPPALRHPPATILVTPALTVGRLRAHCRRGRRDHPAIGEQCAPALEQDDAVAQHAPPLPGMTGHHSRGQAVRRLRIRARGQVLAHLSLRYRQLTSVAARPVAPEHLSERHVRAACHQRSRTTLAPSSRQAANSLYRLAVTPREAPAGLSKDSRRHRWRTVAAATRFAVLARRNNPRAVDEADKRPLG
jgi:hypothetical protein